MSALSGDATLAALPELARRMLREFRLDMLAELAVAGARAVLGAQQAELLLIEDGDLSVAASSLAGGGQPPRNLAIAASSSALTASWNPPSPRTATMLPCRNSAAAASMTRSPSAMRSPLDRSSQSPGPQAGQLFVSEWYRRSPGVVYSRRHAGHCTNARMVVRTREATDSSSTAARSSATWVSISSMSRCASASMTSSLSEKYW